MVRWGALYYTPKISDISEIIGEDLLMKEDKEKLIYVAEELKEKHKTFTDEEIIQLTDWKMEEAKLYGFDEGKKFGIENGIKYTIINMLKKNLDIKLIVEVTGLTEEEIMKIKETL